MLITLTSYYYSTYNRTVVSEYLKMVTANNPWVSYHYLSNR